MEEIWDADGCCEQATIELVNTKRDKSSVFKVHAVNVKVDTLKFAIRDSNHDFLYKTLRPLATGLIKKQIEKCVFIFSFVMVLLSSC